MLKNPVNYKIDLCSVGGSNRTLLITNLSNSKQISNFHHTFVFALFLNFNSIYLPVYLRSTLATSYDKLAKTMLI